MAGDKKLKECTGKQYAFSKCVAHGGMSDSDCYRKIYSTTTANSQSVRTSASRLKKLPHVAHTISVLKSKLEGSMQHSFKSRKERILKVLDQTIEGELSKDSSVMDSNRISAIQLMGKHLNLWGNETVVVQDRDSETLRDELAARLSKLLEKNPSESVPDDQVTH